MKKPTTGEELLRHATINERHLLSSYWYNMSPAQDRGYFVFILATQIMYI